MKKLSNVGTIGRFFSAGEVFNGTNALAGLSRLNVRRVLVIVSNSVFDQNEGYIRKCLSKFAIEIVKAAKGEPDLSFAHNVLPIMKEFSPDIIVAIGGGSVIDGAKLAWVFYEKPEINLDENRTIFPVSNLRSNLTGFVAVPTTYGAGTENSSAAVFQHNYGGKKRFLVGLELIPDVAVLDPDLALDLPLSVAINGIMDTLAHIVEGFVSKY